MFRVSYRVPSSRYGRRTERGFVTYASAQFFFLQKFHEGVPDLRLEVLSSEVLDDVSCIDESEGDSDD